MTGSHRSESLSKQNGVMVRSLCADYFMEMPLLRAADR